MAENGDKPASDLADTINAVGGAANRLADTIENEYRQMDVELTQAVDTAAQTLARHKIATVALIASAGFICGALWARRV